MAAQRTSNTVANKRRGKKRQSRTEVSSSSESESDSDSSVPSQKNESVKSKSSSPSVDDTPEPVASPVKKSKKKSKPVSSAEDVPVTNPAKKSKKSKPTPVEDEDVSMSDAPPPPVAKKSKAPSKPAEDFSAIYLRKMAAELGDDIDKVREAQDFKTNSVPMLIHALKQGESMFSAEEKRRVVGAAGY